MCTHHYHKKPKYLPEKYKDCTKSANASANRLLADFQGLDLGFSVWEALEKRPEGYGSEEFRGNCCPSIIFGFLSRYSSTDHVTIQGRAFHVAA